MRYEDEPFIKVYTRDTIDFLGLSYEARTLCVYLARYVDRAGILRVGKNGLRGVAVAVRAEWSKIEAPLQELIDDGRVRFLPEKGALLIPNHIEMQSASASDPARQRKSRETARALLEAKEEAIPVVLPVTPDEDASRDVTLSVTHVVTPSVTKRDTGRDSLPHQSSRDVTPSVTPRSDQIRSERSEREERERGERASAPPPSEAPSGVHQVATPKPPPSERTDLGGIEAETWAEAVTLATGKPCSPPRGANDIRYLRDALSVHCPPGLDAEARRLWLRDAVRDYAEAKRGSTLTPKWFVERLNSQNSDRPRSGFAPPMQPLAPARPKPAFGLAEALAEGERQRKAGEI